MHRFFVPSSVLTADQTVLPPEIARQVCRVLRLRAGHRIVLFDGGGDEVEAVLGDTGGKEVAVTLGQRTTPDVDLRCRLHVAVAVLKGEKLDWTIQKLTELGAASIHLMLTERTISSAGEERWPKRLERYRRIAREATEQCGGVRAPEVLEPRTLPELAADADLAETRLILDPLSERSLVASIAAAPSSLLLLVGPEGGFSQDEVRRAAEHGVTPVSLGRRVLRAETAAIAAAAIVAMTDVNA
ncbi:MAG: 16S rRNA (uracil(1498)-N(3))-methyltransferase [Actinomycetota bacterium]